METGEVRIHPSMLCADHGEIARDVARLDAGGADCFHMDVMDGGFVPNFGIGSELFKAVRRLTSKPVEAHLMVREPGRHIRMFRDMGADIITIHAEAESHPAAALAAIRDCGAIPGIALNPGTPAQAVRELLPLCGYVLAMTVNPGFAGQSFLAHTLDKIRQLGRLARRHGFTLAADGGINADTAAELLPLGVTSFVIGSALFKESPAEEMRRVRERLGGGA